MRLRKTICMVLTCVLFVGTITLPSYALKAEKNAPENIAMNLADSRATGSFRMTIPAKSKAAADSSFPMAAGETVTIKASYSPFPASVDFGLVAPSGKFYFFNITNGNIDKTVQVEESGKYIFQVRNNADTEVQVLGFVSY